MTDTCATGCINHVAKKQSNSAWAK